MVASFVPVAVAAAALGGGDAPWFSRSATSLEPNDALTGDGVLTTNSLGGHKQVWVGRIGAAAPLKVLSRPFGDPSTPFTKASVVSGALVRYAGASWASRMGFQAGCWQIVGRQLDVTVSCVTQVVVPTTP